MYKELGGTHFLIDTQAFPKNGESWQRNALWSIDTRQCHSDGILVRAYFFCFVLILFSLCSQDCRQTLVKCRREWVKWRLVNAMQTGVPKRRWLVSVRFFVHRLVKELIQKTDFNKKRRLSVSGNLREYLHSRLPIRLIWFKRTAASLRPLRLRRSQKLSTWQTQSYPTPPQKSRRVQTIRMLHGLPAELHKFVEQTEES